MASSAEAVLVTALEESQKQVAQLRYELRVAVGRTSALDAALDRPMEDFMQGDVLSVDEDTDVAEVIDTMIDQRIGALPVVDAHSGRLCGIVSYVDILKVARGVL
jgi:CBS domain-containing protein